MGELITFPGDGLDLAALPDPELSTDHQSVAIERSYETCGRMNRHGEPCAKPAGWGTVHPGKGGCKLHGGKSPYGITSEILKSELGEKIELYRNSPDRLRLDDIIATMRAISDFFLTGDPEREIPPSYEKALNALVQSANAIKAQHDMLYSKRMSVTVDEVRRLLSEIAGIIRTELEGFPDLQERIAFRLSDVVRKVGTGEVVEG